MAGVSEACFARHARSRSPRPLRGGGCRVGSERISLRSEAFVFGRKAAPSDLEPEQDLEEAEAEAIGEDAVIWGEHWTAYIDEHFGMWWHYDGPLGQMWSRDGHEVLPYLADVSDEELIDVASDGETTLSRVDSVSSRAASSLLGVDTDSVCQVTEIDSLPDEEFCDDVELHVEVDPLMYLDSPDEDFAPNACVHSSIGSGSPIPAAPPGVHWMPYLDDERGTWWYYNGPLGHFWFADGQDVLPYHAEQAECSDHPAEAVEQDQPGHLFRPPRPPGPHWTEYVDDELGSWWYYRGPRGRWWMSGQDGDILRYADVDQDAHVAEAAIDAVGAPPGNHWTEYVDDERGAWWSYEGPLGRWCQAEGGALYEY